MVALKWCDVENLRHLHICREEVKESVRVGDTWKDVYTVSEHTKTYTDRSINLVPNAIAILNHIRLKMLIMYLMMIISLPGTVPGSLHARLIIFLKKHVQNWEL